MEAVIIGAGVAGPVAAMALARAGISSTVYEAWPRTDEDIGSWLTIAPNGLDALRVIGAHEAVLGLGFETRATRLWSGSGKLLGDVAMASAQPGALEGRTLRRSSLHRTLRDEAERRGVRFAYGRRLTASNEDPEGVTAAFGDGTTARGDVLVGADGVRSAVRRLVDARAPDARYVGLVNFGGTTPDTDLPDERGMWHMIFGRHAFFGYAIDPVGGAAWFANVPRAQVSPEERAGTSEAEWREILCRLFAQDRGPAVDLIRAGRLELAGDNTCDLPTVPTWSRGRTVLIGDAAHAPSPSSGQGASIAIEDAVVLATCLRDARAPAEAFRIFEEIRRDRVEKVVAAGARSSSSKAPGAFGRIVRDLMLPFVFRHVVTPRSQAWMFDHRIDWERSVIRSSA